MALVIMSVHNLLSRVLSMISGIDVRLSHSTRLSRIFPLGLPLPLLPFSLPVVTMCSILPLLMMCPKNVDCLLLIWLCSSLFELTSFNTSSFRFLPVQGILNIFCKITSLLPLYEYVIYHVSFTNTEQELSLAVYWRR